MADDTKPTDDTTTDSTAEAPATSSTASGTDSTASAPEGTDEAAAPEQGADAPAEQAPAATGDGDAGDAATGSTASEATAEGSDQVDADGAAPVLPPAPEQPSDEGTGTVAEQGGSGDGATAEPSAEPVAEPQPEPAVDAGDDAAPVADSEPAAEPDPQPEPATEPEQPEADPNVDPTVYVPGQPTSCSLDDDNAVIVQMRAGDVCALLQRIERRLPDDTDNPANDDERRTIRLCNVLRGSIGYGPVDHPLV